MYSDDNALLTAEHPAYDWRTRWMSVSRRTRYLRIAAVIMALFGVSRIVLPFRGAVRSFVGGWMDCGVALQTIFTSSFSVCQHYAVGRVYEGLFFLLIAAIILFASGIRRKLRLLGVIVVAASVSLLFVPPLFVEGLLNPCKPVAAYLVAPDPLSPETSAQDLACSAQSSSHFFLTASVAALGFLLLTLDLERRRRRSKRFEPRSAPDRA